jgi:hypothetical protein
MVCLSFSPFLSSLRAGSSESQPTFCKIKIINDSSSSDHRLDCTLSHLSSGDLIFLSQIQFDFLSISSSPHSSSITSTTSSSSQPSSLTFNFTARFSSSSPTSQSTLLLVMSRLMSLCTSHSLFPSLTVKEVTLLPKEKQCGFLKVHGQLLKSKKRDRTELTESTATTDDDVTDRGVTLFLVEPSPSPTMTVSLRCLLHENTISSLDVSSLMSQSQQQTLVLTLVPHISDNELIYRIECLSKL